jgi:hypothetical protein
MTRNRSTSDRHRHHWCHRPVTPDGPRGLQGALLTPEVGVGQHSQLTPPTSATCTAEGRPRRPAGQGAQGPPPADRRRRGRRHGPRPRRRPGRRHPRQHLPLNALRPRRLPGPGVVARTGPGMRASPVSGVDGRPTAGAQDRTHPDHHHRPTNERRRRCRRYVVTGGRPRPRGGPRPKASAPLTETAPGSSQPGPFVARSTSYLPLKKSRPR